MNEWRRRWQWLRTVRHFPISALWSRAHLKIARKLYRPLPSPVGTASEWKNFVNQQAVPWQLPQNFTRWQYRQLPEVRERMSRQAVMLLEEQTGELLNESFLLYQDVGGLSQNLPIKPPLWRENYGYLEFLLPLIFELAEAGTRHYETNAPIVALLESQFRLFRQLDYKAQSWSTYGVSRRLLVCCELLPVLDIFPDALQEEFWRFFIRDARYVACFPELDIRGNHLVKNLKAWLAATLTLEKLPATARMAESWWQELSGQLARVFPEQVLADGFHYERTPMYHVWVLTDLLDCLHWLEQEKLDFPAGKLKTVAAKMLDTLAAFRHSSGQLPMFGDSSLPQTPDPAALLAYGQQVLSEGPAPAAGGLIESSLLSGASSAPVSLSHFPQAGFVVFRQVHPAASLVLDCGDLGPRALPAHSHCDLGSFELHVEHQPIIVDAGISEYEPSLLRDYFRGTAAHNSIWVPGEEQAEIWGSFRVAEYPDFQGCQVEQDSSDAKVTLAYENYRRRYRHQRSVYSVSGRFWVVQDWLTHLSPADRPCFSLLHLHPDLGLHYENEVLNIGNRLLLLPFGYQGLEWSNDSPWRNNLNLYSPGFSQARTGKLVAMVPRLADCFGWVLIPFRENAKPLVSRLGEGTEMHFTEPDEAYRLTWDSSGLHVAVHAPAP
jgi:hypothetical protein